MPRKDYAIDQGYDFRRIWQTDENLPAGREFRFTIYEALPTGDFVALIGSGITTAAAEWQLIVDTSSMAIRRYRYSHDFKDPSEDWTQMSTGEFRITDPRELV